MIRATDLNLMRESNLSEKGRIDGFWERKCLEEDSGYLEFEVRIMVKDHADAVTIIVALK